MSDPVAAPAANGGDANAATPAGSNGASKPAAAAAAGGAQISRQDLILLVQKLQKRAAASDQQVAQLRKQLAEQANAAASATPIAAAASDATGAVAHGDADVAALQSRLSNLQSQLTAQAAAHQAQTDRLQSELQLRSDALTDVRQQLAASREETEAAKKRAAAALEDGRRLQAQLQQLQQQAAAAAVPIASPVPSVSPAPVAAAAGGGSFLLENANKELRAALKDAESKHALALQKSTHYQQLVGALEKQMSEATRAAAADKESLSKRVTDAEARLATSDAKLLTSFQLVNEEKKRYASMVDEGKAAAAKTAHLQAQLTQVQDLLRESTAQLEQAQGDNNALRTANFKLSQRLDSANVDEADDVRELRKTLASRAEEVAALRNELDHTRAIHARTIGNMENELTLQASELERAVDEEKRQVERTIRQLHELTTRTDVEREASAQRAAALEQRAEALQAERDDAVKAHEQLTAQAEQLQFELESLRAAHAAAEDAHAASYAQLSSSSSEKYARLLQELKNYKVHTINAQVSLRNEVETLTATNARLEEEMRHGRPGERKLFELAALQAGRDDALREAEREAAAARQSLVELRGRLEQVKGERDFLAQEVKQGKNSQNRAQVNLESVSGGSDRQPHCGALHCDVMRCVAL
jgi:chromosome segregation ATPase